MFKVLDYTTREELASHPTFKAAHDDANERAKFGCHCVVTKTETVYSTKTLDEVLRERAE